MIDQIRETYILENEELLSTMEETLLILEKEPNDNEAINSLFRAVHTIKGSSGIMSNHNVGAFAHVLENFLDKVRSGEIEVTPEMTAVLLACHDHFKDLLKFDLEVEGELTAKLSSTGEKLLADLKPFSNDEQQGLAESDNDSDEQPKEVSDNFSGQKVQNKNWHISIRTGSTIFEEGFDPLSFISYLKKYGEIINLYTLPDAVALGKEFNAEKSYLGFEIVYSSTQSKQDIEEVFEFIQDISRIQIIEPQGSLQQYYTLLQESGVESSRLLSILADMQALTANEAATLAERNPHDDISQKTDDAVEQKKSEIDKPVSSGNGSQESAVKRFIRVDSDKLDQLINLVGELVITNSNLSQLAESSEDDEITETASTMTRLVEEIRESSMDIRMVEIGGTFRQYERVVRDLARQSGKDIRLVMKGTETELDKTIIEKLSDPLIHLVRNAADHGIDSAEKRAARGKSEQGTVILNAYPDMGSIVIEVEDDGNGIDKKAVLAKAIERDIANADTQYSDSDIHNFIFEPGFSTSKEVTDVSGRGVGMDVVKRKIESLRGTVTIESTEGVGSLIRIVLPLTLAIIDGFLVMVADHHFIIPLDAVQETIDLPDNVDRTGGDFLNLRGDVLPFLMLSELFELDSTSTAKKSVIVVETATIKAGLVVDKIIGEFQTVIKPLGKIFEKLSGISGATILGSGEVALILDVARLIQRVKIKEKVVN